MKLSLREKREFYEALARLARSGNPLPTALERLSRDTGRGAFGEFLRRLHTATRAGTPLADAIAAERRMVSDLEASIIAAAERSGRLGPGCEQLAAYFGALEKSRRTVWRRSLYPLFLLHFGVFVLALPRLFTGTSLAGYLTQTVGLLLILYLVAGAAAAGVRWLLRLGARIVAVDRFLRVVPILGKLRTDFATARFCATYDAQLEAGVNVLDAFASAARASGSALVVETARSAMPELRKGARVGEQLHRRGAFSRETIRAFRLAEETGGLDRELPRLAQENEHDALGRVETLSEWVPRAIYLLIAILIGWQMVSLYRRVVAGYMEMLSF